MGATTISARCVSLRVLSLLSLLIGFGSATRAAARAPDEIRQRVMRNVGESRAARASSGYGTFARFNELYDESRPAALRWQAARRPQPQPKKPTRGPSSVPDGWVVLSPSFSRQPSLRFDKSSRRVKRDVLRKAAKLRMDPTLSRWTKIRRLEQVIGQKVEYAKGGLDDVESNPNPYNRFNRRMKDSGGVATLSDYLELGHGVCRELACLTQVALEAAGFEARLVTGMIRGRDGKPLFSHAWNEIKVKGKWKIVDPTMPKFDGTDAVKARTTGTSNGWLWDRYPSEFEIRPAGR